MDPEHQVFLWFRGTGFYSIKMMYLFYLQLLSNYRTMGPLAFQGYSWRKFVWVGMKTWRVTGSWGLERRTTGLG